MTTPDVVALQAAPAVKSPWIAKHDSSGRVVRVMAVVEGWVVARFKGAAPFLLHANDWNAKFQPAPELRKEHQQ